MFCSSILEITIFGQKILDVQRKRSISYNRNVTHTYYKSQLKASTAVLILISSFSAKLNLKMFRVFTEEPVYRRHQNLGPPYRANKRRKKRTRGETLRGRVKVSRNDCVTYLACRDSNTARKIFLSASRWTSAAPGIILQHRPNNFLSVQWLSISTPCVGNWFADHNEWPNRIFTIIRPLLRTHRSCHWIEITREQ